MPAVKFTDKAEADLEGIVQFTRSTWGVDQANRYIDGLEQLTARLAEQPAMGVVSADLAEGLRAFPYQSHVLYYLAERKRLTVVRVLHKRMNPALYRGVGEGDT
jgi:toxin ParE1/3/4